MQMRWMRSVAVMISQVAVPPAFASTSSKISDLCEVYDNPQQRTKLLEIGTWTEKIESSARNPASRPQAALRRTGQAARKTAGAHCTPIYVWQHGKVMAQEPWTRSRRFVSPK